ncbi:S-layer homology domain-containing protein [Fusibacter bizertensis]
MRNNKAKRYLSVLMVLMLIISSVAVPVSADTAGQASHVIISQIYGGGGNANAVFTNDFIELYNPTDQAIDLTGWSVQYASGSGTFSSTKITPLSGSIGAGEYYLIQEGSGGATGAALPTANVLGDINMSGSSGKVALVSSTEVITGKADGAVVDFVGYGSSASEFEGTGKTPTLDSTKAAIRKSVGVDTDDNAADFIDATPTPRAGAIAPETKCATPTAKIAAGVVLENTQLTFVTATQDATIEYNTVAVDHDTWTTGNSVTITGDTTYYVRAVKGGLENSDVATFTYTVDMTAPLTVAEAKAAPLDTINVKVKGIVSYLNGSSVYIQDTTGAICLYLTASPVGIKVGDEIVTLGTRTNYSNLIELTNVREAVTTILTHDNSIPDRGTATVAQIIATPEGKTLGYDHMCEVIDIEGVTLTSTTKLSQEGSELTISPALDIAKFPGVTVGDAVNVTIRVSGKSDSMMADIINMTKVGAESNLYLTVTPDATDVTTGATVLISCSDVAANIYYTLDGSEPTASSMVYANHVVIEGNIGDVITLKAIAMADGKNDSEVLTAKYKIKDPAAALTIKDVLNLTSGTANVDVVGTLSYFATSFSNPVIQSVIEGKTYSLYVYGAAPNGAKIGDVIKLNGTYSLYKGLPELTSIKSSSIIESVTPIPPEEKTIADLNANGLSMIGRVVKIKDVTLGVYNGSGNSPITDKTGSMNLYKATSYPTLVEAGDVVDLYAMVACYNTTIQLYTGTKEANGYNVYDVVNDTKNPLVTLKDVYLEAKPGQDYTIAVTAEDNKGIDNVKLSYAIGATTYNDIPMVYDDSTKDYKYTISGDQIVKTENNIKFTVTAMDVSNLQTTSQEKSITINGAPQILSVFPARNGSTGDVKAPVISVALSNAGSSPVVKFTLKKDATTIVDHQDMTTSDAGATYQYATAPLADGTYSASVTVTREDTQSTTVTWSFTIGEPKFTAYFGQLHAHTAQYSDGSGTLADGLTYLTNIPASDNIDFVSFTDHSNYFDTVAAPNPVEALNDKTKMTAESLATWDAYVSTMLTFNESKAGSLLAMPGFEMTWSGGPGHINTFNSEGIVSRNNANLKSKSDVNMKNYYDALIQNTDPLANLSQFNHPGATFGTFSDFAYWSPAYDDKMVAVEVGNGEGSIGSGGYFPSYSEYTKALDKGWHVAPTNNQDNHKGHWGNANTARTVIIGESLSTTGLLTGLKNMSVYATEDKNLNIDYTVNDLMMGSIISEVPTEPLKFAINISDDDNSDSIAKVEVISNGGRVVVSKTFASNVAQWDFELPSAQGYYYLRVTEADKNLAVTAPIWVGKAPLVGISSFETATKLPVTDEALKFDTILFNNESSSVLLKSINYTIGEQKIAGEDLNANIATADTYKYSFSYTPKAIGNTTVTATAVIVVDGQEKTFTQDITLNVRDSEKLVYVGIDASHFNEYVQGNYKANMGNFANLAVASDVRVVELATSDALIAATKNAKYKMIILTPPTRRAGDYFLKGYLNYTDDEIAAIKAFAESGNTVVITGWGDYYESYTKYSDGAAYTLPAEDHMAVQQNKLLEAIGANLRVSDDEVKDKEKHGGKDTDYHRLYLTNYNMDNIFVKNVKPAEQIFSCYGGSTVYVVGSDGAPSATLPSNVSPIVYSFTTSYSSDDDKSGTTNTENVPVPKYDDKYLVAASETVNHSNGNKSMVIVSGPVFMSNFEIQVELDSYATPAYSNLTIVESLINYINPAVITDISAVQSAAEGETFTIQGIVTSNASGYDKDTAFFDCIYVQDSTGGINAFPVSGEVRKGQTVQITGKTSSYNGERQIAVDKIKIIDSTIKTLPAPIVETTSVAASGGNLGSLVKVSGTITSIGYANNIVESIFVKDSSNVETRVFIDGYITKNKIISNLQVGATLTAVGLSSIDTEGARIRIRDRADIICMVPNAGNDNNQENDDNNGDKKEDVKTPAKVETNKDENNSSITKTITVGLEVQKDGSKTATVSKDNLTQLLDEIKNPVETVKKAIVEIKVDGQESDKDVEIVLDRSAFSQIATDTKAEIKLSTGFGSILLDSEALKKINAEAGSEDIKVGITKSDVKSLSTEVQKVVGDRPVYDFTVTAGDKTVSSFGSGSVQVSLPYEIKENEDVNSIVVYYVADDGTLQKIRGNYNPATKTVDFETSHFSTYMVGYNQVSFTDVVKTDWFYDSVSYIVARDIASGTGGRTFTPNAKVTRGQFMVMVMNAYGIAPLENATDNFADAGNTYYTNYLAAAKKLGITNGVGNNLFAPEKMLSRQDMITMLYQVLKYVNEVPESNQVKRLDVFNDVNQIASYATESLTAFVEAGLLNGSYNNLNPRNFASRAELAQILSELLMIK